MNLKPFLFVCTYLILLTAFGQTVMVSGQVVDAEAHTVSGVTIYNQETRQGTTSDLEGVFRLKMAAGEHTLVFSHVQYVTGAVHADFRRDTLIEVVLKEQTAQLNEVQVSDSRISEDPVVSVFHIDAKSARKLPSAFGDFNKVLVTLPGVSGNNELSSAYSVRGGNFSENLVYVNDIPVYRPFLSSVGQQQGLSFINPDMVDDIEFYAGGWEPKYGDKLSSSLNISYKEPDSLEASATAGLLGGRAYVGGRNKRMSYLAGVRYQDSRYLLNTLQVNGQYFPRFADFQAFLTFDLSRRHEINKTKLNILLSYANNRYLSIPESQTTEFGTFNEKYRLSVAFEGRETMRYDTYQSGFRLTHRFSEHIRTHFIGSVLFSTEREFYDVEGAYRLCDIDTDPSSTTFDKCVSIKGAGVNYQYGRNQLHAKLVTIEDRWEVMLNASNILEAGAGVTFQDMHDQLNEYAYVDSADYVSLTESVFNKLNLNTHQYYAYLQNTTISADSVHALVYGIRLTYWDYNDQLLVSPRVAYRFAPRNTPNITWKLSVGVYQQPPFYRELRTHSGELISNVKAQQSVHFILGNTYLFYMWGRPFFFTSDVYYKMLYRIIPYDIEDLKIRYYPEYTGQGYAVGADFRVNGEFIKGTQSWFSLGILKTAEQIDGDGRGYVRRPMDQRVNVAAYFEDHMPNDPTLRVYLNAVFGSGYPFGPPNNMSLRNVFQGDQFYRIDLGLAKEIDFETGHFLNKMSIRLEVLNALGIRNTLSYTWIQDVNGNQYAVPNSLSARFLNVRVSAEL